MLHCSINAKFNYNIIKLSINDALKSEAVYNLYTASDFNASLA